jgi:hypothetical protein
MYCRPGDSVAEMVVNVDASSEQRTIHQNGRIAAPTRKATISPMMMDHLSARLSRYAKTELTSTD